VHGFERRKSLHWGFNGIISFTFLKLENSIGIASTFGFYSLICLLGLWWGYYFIPETKGRSLEQIEEHWQKGGDAINL